VKMDIVFEQRHDYVLGKVARLEPTVRTSFQMPNLVQYPQCLVVG